MHVRNEQDGRARDETEQGQTYDPIVTTTLDCALLRELHGTPELRAIFATAALVQSWLDIEAALAAAEELAADPEVTRHVSPDQLTALADPSSYFGLAATSAANVADRVEGASSGSA